MANIDIGGRLHSTATGNVVAGANEILDDNEQKKQSQINAELIEAVEDLNEEMATKQNTITAVVNPEIVEDGGAPSVTTTFNNGQIGFAFKNLKGNTGATGPEGRQGPQGESFQPIENPSGLILKHVLGQDNSKAMSQKGVTDAIVDLLVSEFESFITPSYKSSMYIDDSGVVASKTTYYRVYYRAVETGQWIHVVCNGVTASTSPATEKAVAVFDSVPAVGAQGVLLDYIGSNQSFDNYYQMPQDGYLAVYVYGNQATVQYAYGKTQNDKINSINQRLSDILAQTESETLNPTTSVAYSNYYIKYADGKKSSNSSFNITNPVDVERGDIVIATCKGGSSGGNAVIARYNEGADYTPLVKTDKTGALKDWTWIADENCKVAFSYVKTSGGTLTVTIHRKPPLLRDVAMNNKDVEDIRSGATFYREFDHMPQAGTNPLGKMLSGPSRARIFRSYGIIGASWETAFTNGNPNNFYDTGRDWPTMFGQVNNVEMRNYSLAGHALANWLLHRDDTTFDSEDASIKPECFIINMSSNEMDTSKYSGEAGDADNLDLNHDYRQDTVTTSTVFVEVLANIIQRCRAKSPKCYIYLCTCRKYTPSGSGGAERMAALCQAMREVANRLEHCYVLDINQYGADWSDDSVSDIYRSSDLSGSHPSRLGHIYLFYQFNTYIDWHVSQYPAEYRDVAYINSTNNRT